MECSVLLWALLSNIFCGSNWSQLQLIHQSRLKLQCKENVFIDTKHWNICLFRFEEFSKEALFLYPTRLAKFYSWGKEKRPSILCWCVLYMSSRPKFCQLMNDRETDTTLQSHNGPLDAMNRGVQFSFKNLNLQWLKRNCGILFSFQWRECCCRV